MPTYATPEKLPCAHPDCDLSAAVGQTTCRWESCEAYAEKMLEDACAERLESQTDIEAARSAIKAARAGSRDADGVTAGYVALVEAEARATRASDALRRLWAARHRAECIPELYDRLNHPQGA